MFADVRLDAQPLAGRAAHDVRVVRIGRHQVLARPEVAEHVVAEEAERVLSVSGMHPVDVVRSDISLNAMRALRPPSR